MRHIIDAIAAQGRHGDDELLHVSKRELAALDRLAEASGTHLTRNPRTGIREAFNIWPTLGGIAGGIAGTFVTPGAGTAAGAALGSGAATAASGGTTEQALTNGLISGVTAYAGGAALGSMSEAGAAGADIAAQAGTDAATTGVTQAGTDATANAGSGLAGNTVDAGGAMNTGVGADTVGVKSLDVASSANPVTPAESSGLAGNTVTNGGAMNTGTAPTTPAAVTKPEFSFSNVNQYLKETPATDVAKKYGTDFAKTAMGAGMVGMTPIGEAAPIEIPGQDNKMKYKAEYYQGPGGEIRTRSVPMAGGGEVYGDYDGVEDAAAGGIMGYAGGGALSSTGTAGGGISTVNVGVRPGNVRAKTGSVLPSEFFSKEDYARATPEERATMDRLMAAQREFTPSPMRRTGAGYAGGGGIGFIRSIQPGGQWGDMTSDAYGVVQEHKPEWLQKIEPGGFLGATVPGKMDWEDKQRAAKEAEEAKQREAEAAAKKLAAQNSLKQELDATMARNMAAGGIASFGKGRYLQGAGDGMSDSIPADIDGKQPARLATGEFVVPADVVSGLGNGDSTAGAKQLHAMMDRTRQARTGTKKQGKQINPRKMMPV